MRVLEISNGERRLVFMFRNGFNVVFWLKCSAFFNEVTALRHTPESATKHLELIKLDRYEATLHIVNVWNVLDKLAKFD